MNRLPKIIAGLLYFRVKVEDLDDYMVAYGFKSNMDFIKTDNFENFLKENMAMKYINDNYCLNIKFFDYENCNGDKVVAISDVECVNYNCTQQVRVLNPYDFNFRCYD